MRIRIGLVVGMAMLSACAAAGDEGDAGGAGGTGAGGTGGSGAGGSGGGGDACGGFVPCGGDLAGSWTFTAACLGDVGNPFDNCAEALVGYELTPSGSLVFEAADAYSLTFSLMVASTTTLPSSCLPNGCADLEGEFGTCSPTATGCTCTDSGSMNETTETGTFSVHGTAMVLDENDQLIDTHLIDYCVEGDTLRLRSMKPPSVGDEVVLTLTRG